MPGGRGDIRKVPLVGIVLIDIACAVAAWHAQPSLTPLFYFVQATWHLLLMIPMKEFYWFWAQGTVRQGRLSLLGLSICWIIAGGFTLGK